MEWCCASNIGDCVVPKNLEAFDRFPSPESWLHKWGRTEPGSFSFNNNNKGFAIDNFNGGFESCGYDKDWSNSQESSFQQALDYQLLSLDGGFESTDDLYLSSIIEDLPENEEFYNSYSMETELQNEMVDCDGTSTDMILDTKSSSVDTHSVGSSKYLKTHAFSPSLDQGEARVSAPLKSPVGKVLVPCGQNSSSEKANEETCLEESVLEELGMVMSQMTENTRLCFRDSLYRLAKNSGTEQEDKMRLKGKKTNESETNTNAIDRTVANLLFNKMDMNVNDYPFATSASSQDESLEAIGLENYTSNQEQICSFPQYSSFSRDDEVRLLCQGMSSTIQFAHNP